MSRFPGFRLQLTPWGAVFLGVVLVLVLAAVNTGNNALVLLLGLALGSYAVSGFWSRQVLAAVIVEARAPREVFAGRPVVVELTLVNRSRWLPAYGLVLRNQQGKVLLVEPLLGPGQRRRRQAELTLWQRGWQELGPWRLEVLLPLGFFCKSKEVVREQPVLAYPHLHPRRLAGTSQQGELHAEETVNERGREGEVTGLRGFQEGDELRQIHWKQTARQERLMVVERQRLDRAAAYLVVDPRVADPSDRQARQRFERLLSRAATTIVERLQRYQAIGLIVDSRVIPAVSQPTQAAVLLRPLAEAQLLPRAPAEPATPVWQLR